MISGIHITVRKSERVRARGDEPVENGDAPPPAPADWQAMLTAMEARLLRAEEDARRFGRQAKRQIPEAIIPPVQPPAPVLPVVAVNTEPLLERFRKQHPPTFEGRTDPLVDEQWMDLVTSILDFMVVAGNDMVSCASYIL